MTEDIIQKFIENSKANNRLEIDLAERLRINIQLLEENRELKKKLREKDDTEST